MKRNEHEIIRKVANFIQKNNLFEGEKPLVVSVSGGVDSVVLLYTLIKLGHEVSSIVHFNHHIREEAGADAEFVRLIGKSLGIAVEVIDLTFSADDLANFEARAHKARSAFYNKLNKEQEIYVAMGHHADDVLETTLINLLRGGGLNIIGGIPFYKHPIVRPLLCLNREEIRFLAQKWALSWVEDSSNADTHYLRNFLRRDIIPLLKTRNPRLAHTHLTTALRFQKLYDFMLSAVDGGIGYIVSNYEPLTLIVERMQEMQEEGEPVEEVLYKLLKPYGVKFSAIHEVMDLLDAPIGSIWQGEKIAFIRNETDIQEIPVDMLHMDLSLNTTITEEDEHFIGSDFILHHYATDNMMELEPDSLAMRLFIGNDSLKWPLHISRYQAGDKIRLQGMKGRKDVAHLLAEHHVPVLLRGHQVVVRDASNEIVWLPGIRVGKLWATKTIVGPARLFHFSKK